MIIILNNIINDNNIMALDEKSVSKAQQRFMGMVLDKKRHPKKKVSKSVAKAAAGMSKKDIEDFASTKHKGLPNHVDEFKISKKNILLKENPVAPMGPNAMGGAMPAAPMAPAQDTPSTIDIARQKGNESMKQVIQSYNPSGKTEDNNTQGQPADATAENQAQAQVAQQPQQLSEADLKYISRKALSILREWTK